MSEELKNKMFDWEFTPPPQAWDKLAAALDGEIFTGFPHMLREASVTPPLSAWENIQKSLSAGNTTGLLSSRLAAFEEIPPIMVWENIQSSLDEEKTPRIGRNWKKSPVFRYAAAACLIGLVAFGISLLATKTSEGSMAIQPQGETGGNFPAPTPGTVYDSVSTPRENMDEKNNGQVFSRPVFNTRKKYQAQTASYMTSLGNISTDLLHPSTGMREASLQDEIPGCNTVVCQTADRYLLFTNPEGYLIRMSKKLAQTLECLNDGNAGTNDPCTEQVKKWKDKLAQSPSSDNFMDILNMIKSIEDNKL